MASMALATPGHNHVKEDAVVIPGERKKIAIIISLLSYYQLHLHVILWGL
jgi:hypothetical protein